MTYPTDPIGWAAIIGLGGLGFLFVITLVVFVHELGHFLAARYFGVRVESFSIGFGRALIGFTDRYGTAWKVGWLPLGGYVKFWGDDGVSSTPDHEKIDRATEAERKGSFHHKALYKKAIIAVAGPVANFILAILIFTVMYSALGTRHTVARIDLVKPGTPAQAAGFQPGDVVVKVEDQNIRGFEELVRIVSLNQDRELAIVVQRGAETVTVRVAPRLIAVDDPLAGKIKNTGLGLVHDSKKDGPSDVRFVRLGPIEALSRGLGDTWYIVAKTFDFIGQLLTGRGDYQQLSGPIGIATVSGQVLVFLGVVALINLAAVLSVSIGLLNLFPIPMLDGGHLLYYGIEAVRGRPLGERAQELGFQIGFALVVSLMLFATWNDLTKLKLF
jgi:regulator of sigma E protease